MRGHFCAARARSLRADFPREFYIVKKIFQKISFKHLTTFPESDIIYSQRNKEKLIMKIKAVYDINVDIEEFVKVEGLNKNSTYLDIARAVENYVNEINKKTLYTVMDEEEYKLIQGIQKFLGKC